MSQYDSTLPLILKRRKVRTVIAVKHRETLLCTATLWTNSVNIIYYLPIVDRWAPDLCHLCALSAI